MLRTIALTGLAALVAATTISLAPPAHAQIGNIFSDPPPRPPGAIPRGSGSSRRSTTTTRRCRNCRRGRLLPTPNRPPPGQGAPPPGAVQSQPLAPPPGTTVVPQNTQPGHRRRAAATRLAPAPRGGAGRGVGAACRRRRPRLQPGDEVVSEPPAHEDRQQEGELLRPRQDHRPHHQFRRGYRRDRAVRRAAREDQCLLHAAGDGGRQHRRLCRGRRDHAAGRGEADLLRLDVSRRAPACTASSIRSTISG